MAELKALSKLKQAGKLHYWRGTIEIDEHELHTICDEIQAEYDKVVAAMNKAAGNWAKAESLVREMDRNCRGCKFPCYTEKGSCGIITRIDELLGL